MGSGLGVWPVLELGLVVVLALVLGVGQGTRHRVKAMCRAGDGRRKSRSGRAGARCGARAGCTAKARARGKVVQVSQNSSFFFGQPCDRTFSWCWL